MGAAHTVFPAALAVLNHGRALTGHVIAANLHAARDLEPAPVAP